MATRITLTGSTQYEVTQSVDDINQIVASGWTGAILVTTTEGANVMINVQQITSVQAT